MSAVGEIPTEEDWRSEHTGIDWPCAYENFHGRTFDETITLLTNGGSTEDFAYMPIRVFPFYFHAYATFLLTDASKGASDEASAFIGLIEYRLKYFPDLVRSLWPKISEVLTRLSESQEFYDASVEIYDSFSERCAELTRAATEKLHLQPT